MPPEMRSGKRVTPSLLRSFAGKMTLLLAIIVLFPVLIYLQLESADQRKNELLVQSVQREGEIIVRSLIPVFAQFKTLPPDALQENLDRLRLDSRTIKVLARPEIADAPDRFYYLASSPQVRRQRLDEERSALLATGIFDRLSDTCEGGRPLATRFVNPAGEAEILASLVPVQTGGTCFVVVTSLTGTRFLQTALGRPFWQTKTLHIAALLYAMMAALVVWLYADAWRNLRRFRATAQAIRSGGPEAGSFAMRNRIPELSPVAEDIDSMIKDLDRSRRFIRDAAEETAHALKAPLAVIAQALEPLKRSLPDNGNGRAERSLALIESSIGRSDAIISAVRDLDRHVAESLERGKQPVNLGALLTTLGSGFRATLETKQVDLETRIADDVGVAASIDALETIFENILENSASFAPSKTRVELTVEKRNGWAVVEIADEGPGVDPQQIEAIFERHVSLRAGAGNGGGPRPPTTSFGLGLWIVRRNTEVLGGDVTAENRDPSGLLVRVRLPLA